MRWLPSDAFDCPSSFHCAKTSAGSSYARLAATIQWRPSADWPLEFYKTCVESVFAFPGAEVMSRRSRKILRHPPFATFDGTANVVVVETSCEMNRKSDDDARP